jgi:hypothetical protein
MGPAAAMVCALRFVEQVVEKGIIGTSATVQTLWELPARYAAAHSVDVDLFGEARQPLALIGGEAMCELAFPLRWKLLEGLRVPDPPVWDLLQVVHGPLQSFYESSITLLVIENQARPYERQLIDRLASLLEPTRPRLLRFSVDTGKEETPLSLLSGLLMIDAGLNAALLQTLNTHPIELAHWPLRNSDAALYAACPQTFGLSE